jgi:hypothetical protein
MPPLRPSLCPVLTVVLCQCLQRFDEKDARTCLDVVSDMVEAPLPFLSSYIEVTARAMAQVRARHT